MTIVGQNFFSELGFLTGATLTSESLTLDGVTVTSHSTSPVWVPDASSFVFVNDAILQSTGAGVAPFIHIAAAGMAQVLLAFGQLGDGTSPVLTVDAGQFATIQQTNASAVLNHALAGGGTANLGTTSDSTVGALQAVAVLHTILESDAVRTKYTPGVPGNWVGPAPTTVLDRIAANVANAHPIP